MDNIITLILAGGRHKKIDILCQHRAKPAISFGGNTRIIDYTMSNCIHSMIKTTAVIVDYHQINMAIYLNRWISRNGGGMTLHLLEPRYGSYQGNADAVYQNIDFLKRSSSDLVMILPGDHVCKMDLQKVLDHHCQSNADLTIGVTSVHIEQANHFGVVTIEGNSRITGFIEKPDIPQNNTVSMGIYIINKQLLINSLIEDAAISSSPHDFGHAIIPRMIRKYKANAFVYDSYWRDIGSPQAYYDANMELLPEIANFITSGDWPILTESNRFELPRISSRGSIQNSIISPGCVIKGQVINSILSPGVWIEEEAIIRDSVIMANSFIGYHSVVDHCILSEGTNVGRLCYLGFGGSVAQGEGVIVVGDQVTVPPHTAIGRNCRILPHTGLADFVRKVFPSDSIISPQAYHKTWGNGISNDISKRLQAFRPAE